MLLFHLNSESFVSCHCLNQMIRLISFTIGGRAYLNFMGNEFGHPEVTLQIPTLPKTLSSGF